MMKKLLGYMAFSLLVTASSQTLAKSDKQTSW